MTMMMLYHLLLLSSSQSVVSATSNGGEWELFPLFLSKLRRLREVKESRKLLLRKDEDEVDDDGDLVALISNKGFFNVDPSPLLTLSNILVTGEPEIEQRVD